MRILVIGADGTTGSQVVKTLQGRHEIVTGGRRAGVKVDIADPVATFTTSVPSVDLLHWGLLPSLV